MPARPPFVAIARAVRALRGAMLPHGLIRIVVVLASLVAGHPLRAAPPGVIDANTYYTEHCLFVIDTSVTWGTPATAYSDVYASPFNRLRTHFATLTSHFPASYFSICYMANTGASNVPNYIDQIYKATGISTGLGSAGLGTSGSPLTPQSFDSVDFCRYNLSGSLFGAVHAVYDHELGHAWGAQFFNNVSGVGPGILSNGHWLSNNTIDCQMSATYSGDGGATVNKIYGDPVNGFRYQRVDNLRSNDVETFSEQQLYLMGLRRTFPTTYALNNPVYNSDLTVGSSSVETYDHAAALARYGARNPDYTTAQKQFKLGFVYIARDLAEINAVYQVVEQSIVQYCSSETINTSTFRFQIPFLVNTHFRASVDARLADLDGNTTPLLTVADTYISSTDGTATIHFTASDPAGPAPTVSLIPASTQASIVGSTVLLSGLPDGTHFFTLKAVNAAGKKAFGHFVVDVQRPVTSTAISSQPVTRTVFGGANATFSVTATGSPATYTYQWFRQNARTSTWNALSDGGAYSGTSTASLTVTASTAMDGDQFLCVVTNATGEATSTAAALVVNESAPTFSAQPADKAVAAGSVATFSVAPVGAPLTFGYFTYQWQRQTLGSGPWNNLTNGAGVTGADTASLSISGTTLPMSGDLFRCVVTNTAGSNTSNSASLTVNQLPAITTQPQNVTAALGAAVSFTVVATGTAPLSYQWSRYATPIPGATSATLTLTNIQASDQAAYVVTVTNAAGSIGSNAASLTISGVAAPSIVTHPQSASVLTGGSVSFSVTASGGAPLSYQWSKGGAPISGATSSTYSISSAQLSDAGTYSVTVSNSAGSAVSGNATLSVTAAPVAPGITTQPASTAVTVGSAVQFSVTATGTAPLSYQWSMGGVAISGATAPTYNIAGAQFTDAGSYTVSISNSVGSIASSAATLTVNAIPPTIATPPQDLTVLTGSAATFSVLANGTAPFTYQWFKNGTAISGATSAAYAMASAQASDAGSYAVRVTNSAGSATSSAATLTVAVSVTPPTITAQPQSATVTAGLGVSFVVTASGTSPFTYQWSRNGVPISGAVAATYTLTTTQLSDAGAYSVVVTNSAGSATSAAATLTVNAVPVTITSQPVGSTGFTGSGVTLSVTVAGTGPFSYQWLKNGAPISGANSSSLYLGGLTSGDAGDYSVTVTNNAGSVTSQVATVTVQSAGTLPTSVLINLSVRTTLASGQRLIPGFVTNGSKPLLLRIAGPTLTALNLGLSGYPDPVLQVYNSSSQLIAQNDNWDSSLAPLFNQLGAFPFVTNGKDSALLTTVSGLNSAMATGTGSGTVLMELYDTQTDYANRLINVSARNQVGTGADALIVGFVIVGSGTKQLLIRGVGPTLTHFGVGGALADPVLQVYDVNGSKIAENDNWSASLAPTFAQVGAFALDAGSKDAALLISLPPGIYSAKLTGLNNGTGEGLVEVYEVWP